MNTGRKRPAAVIKNSTKQQYARRSSTPSTPSGASTRARIRAYTGTPCPFPTRPPTFGIAILGATITADGPRGAGCA